MKLKSKKEILEEQQFNNALGGRVHIKDLTIAQPITYHRMPVIQLDVKNIKNTKGTVYGINRLSPYLT